MNKFKTRLKTYLFDDALDHKLESNRFIDVTLRTKYRLHHASVNNVQSFGVLQLAKRTLINYGRSPTCSVAIAPALELVKDITKIESVQRQ